MASKPVTDIKQTMGEKDEFGFDQFDLSGYEDQSSDAVGMWVKEKGPIGFIPQYARLMDSKLDSTKISIIVFGKLTHPSQALEKDENPVEGKVGDVVGVFVAAGSKKLPMYCGIPVVIGATEKIKLKNRKEPMQDFRILSKGEPNKLVPLESDYRKDSKRQPTPWDNTVPRAVPKRVIEDDDVDDSDIPF